MERGQSAVFVIEIQQDDLLPRLDYRAEIYSSSREKFCNTTDQL